MKKKKKINSNNPNNEALEKKYLKNYHHFLANAFPMAN